jgi:hypothetical protein
MKTDPNIADRMHDAMIFHIIGRKLKTSKYIRRNRGRPKKVKRIVNTFRFFDPSVWKMYVNIARKSIISMMEIIAF